MKLYLVECRGMTVAIQGEIVHGKAYVIANDPGAAYDQLREFLDKKDLGFRNQRELLSVTLLAEMGDYPSCGMRLFLPTVPTYFPVQFQVNNTKPADS